jgi:hypothetical protein
MQRASYDREMRGTANTIAGFDANGNAIYVEPSTLGGSHYKGIYTTFAALQAAHPTALAGNYARVDGGIGADVVTYIWDDTDSKWVQEKGTGITETATSVKTKYESNADTNAFTDAEKTKLEGLSNTSVVSYSFDTLTETPDDMDIDAREVVAVSKSAGINTVEISINGGAYATLAVGVQIPAATLYKYKISYASGTTGVLSVKTKKI